MVMMMKQILRYVYFLQLLIGIRAIKLLNLSIPSIANLNEKVNFICDFDLQGRNLYSIKWYKDDFEFYRHMPDNTPATQIIDVAGVNVDMYASGKSNIVLHKLTFNSSGMYRCEVSTEAPKFETVVGTGNMSVVALPRTDPTISGIATTYSIGDNVTGTCVSAKSYPPSDLTWYINSIKVEKWFLKPFVATDVVDVQGLHTRSLDIRFQAQRQHFQGSRKRLELKCTAVVGDRSWQKVVTSTLATLTNEKLAQERLSNRAGCLSTILNSTSVLTWLLLVLYSS